MFAKTIIDSDAFLDMPLSAQALYFHLSMRADDDGFINNARKIQRMIGASDDDLKLLLAKNFLIPFDSGIVVVKHWRIHNYIRNDRKHETKYFEEMSMLEVKENGAYTISATKCQSSDGQLVGKLDTEVRLGKDSIGKVNKNKRGNFVPPTLEEVTAYCQERNNGINPQTFIDFYQSKGWFIGKNKMKDWKAAVRTWERNRKDQPKEKSPGYKQFEQREYDFTDLEKQLLGN